MSVKKEESSLVKTLSTQNLTMSLYTVIFKKVGLLKIKQSHQHRGEKLPVSLVVSVGSGIPIYPREKLGSINDSSTST